MQLIYIKIKIVTNSATEYNERVFILTLLFGTNSLVHLSKSSELSKEVRVQISYTEFTHSTVRTVSKA